MFIEKIEQNLIKTNFYTKEEDLFLGDFVKIISSGKKGVLAQVIKIESPDNNQNYNTATSKIKFTIEESGKLTSWQGNIPSNDFIVTKASPKEVLCITNTGDVPNPVLSFGLSNYPDTIANVEASFLERPSVIIADKESQRNDLMELLAYNLAEKEAKVVLIDYNGDFADNEDAVVLKAGKDVKLPFDLQGLELLYEKLLAGVSSEIRVNIENIFVEIEEYLESGKASFLPFKLFVKAVDDESRVNNTPEVTLLSNSLTKLYKKGIFADGQREIISLFGAFTDNNLIVLDLSGVEKDWKAAFVDFVIRLNKEKLKRKFFLLTDLDKYSANNDLSPSEIKELFIHNSVKGGIKPLLSLAHTSGLIENILSETENYFVYAPQVDTCLNDLQLFLSKMDSSDLLLCGNMTNNVPLSIRLPEYEDVSDRFFSAEKMTAQVEINIEQPVTTFEPYVEQMTTFVEKTPVKKEEDFVKKVSEVVDDVFEEAIETLDEQVVEKEQEKAKLEEQIKSKNFVQEEIDPLEAQQQEIMDYQQEVEEYSEEVEEVYEETEELPSADELLEEAEEEITEEQQEVEEYSEEVEEVYEETEELPSADELLEEAEEEVSEEQQEVHAVTDFSQEEINDFVDLDESEENENTPVTEADLEEETEQEVHAVTELSQEEINDFVDLDESEETQKIQEEPVTEEEYEEEYYESEEDDDEDSYYQSSEEFEDESVLDYVIAEGSEEEVVEEYVESQDEPEYEEEVQSEEYEEVEEEYYEEVEEEVEELPSADDLLEEAFGEETEEEQEEYEEVEEEVVVEEESQQPMPGPAHQDLPVYNTSEEGESTDFDIDLKEGDTVRHKKYGIGQIKKVIGYSEKKLCSIQFEDVGRRLLDPKIAELEKVE